jgi:hypothetical protein
MPHERSRWTRRVREVESEYLAVRVAVDWLLAAEQEEIHQIAKDGGHADPPRSAIYTAYDYLAATYLIRMFSVFESAVKFYWQTLPNTDDRQPTAEELIEEVGVARTIATDVIGDAQATRDLRNRLVHGRLGQFAPAVDVAGETIRLLKYLDHLPTAWG